jgi:hypothetical protein
MILMMKVMKKKKISMIMIGILIRIRIETIVNGAGYMYIICIYIYVQNNTNYNEHDGVPQKDLLCPFFATTFLPHLGFKASLWLTNNGSSSQLNIILLEKAFKT